MTAHQPAPSLVDLQADAKKARDEGDDELYFFLKKKIKTMQGAQGASRPGWADLPPPPLIAIDVLDGQPAELEPEPEPEPEPAVEVGAWAKACECDNSECVCDLTARLDDWSGYEPEPEPEEAVAPPPLAAADGQPAVGSAVRVDWAEAEAMVWHPEHLDDGKGAGGDGMDDSTSDVSTQTTRRCLRFMNVSDRMLAFTGGGR